MCGENLCGVIVLTQSEKNRRLCVVGCLYWMSRRPHVWRYVSDDTGVNHLWLPGPVPDIGALLPAQNRVRSVILSLIGRWFGWDERSECMS